MELDWILTEDGQIPEASHVFWKKAKGGVLYVIRQKHPPPLKGWKGQVVKFLHSKSGGATDGSRNLVVMHIETEGMIIV